MAQIALHNLQEAALLGKFLALHAPLQIPYLLSGPLGCGKTTLVRSMMNYLSSTAEVSSPTFSIYNIYPARPPVMHCDLYRCQHIIPEEILEFINHGLLVVEWAEYLPKLHNRLDILFIVDKDTRYLDVTGYGKGKNIEQALARSFPLHDSYKSG